MSRREARRCWSSTGPGVAPRGAGQLRSCGSRTAAAIARRRRAPPRSRALPGGARSRRRRRARAARRTAVSRADDARRRRRRGRPRAGALGARRRRQASPPAAVISVADASGMTCSSPAPASRWTSCTRLSAGMAPAKAVPGVTSVTRRARAASASSTTLIAGHQPKPSSTTITCALPRRACGPLAMTSDDPSAPAGTISSAPVARTTASKSSNAGAGASEAELDALAPEPALVEVQQGRPAPALGAAAAIASWPPMRSAASNTTTSRHPLAGEGERALEARRAGADDSDAAPVRRSRPRASSRGRRAAAARPEAPGRG